MKRTLLCIAALMMISAGVSPLKAQPAGEILIQGKIIDGTTMKPVSFALIVIAEAGLVTPSRQDGSFRMTLPKAGRYTISIESPGLQKLTTVMTIDGIVTRDFTLNPFTSRGNGLTVRGERDIQTVSRQTMTVKQIKEVPASFGDSITALSSLPGVNRPGSFFGPLIIRGADSASNGYYIDDIPLFKPMHFGGIHSVISNDLMQSIDLYASAYPAQFSNAQAAIIDINTIDEVKEFGGNADAGFISANALLKAPLTRSVFENGKEKKENSGYIIGAARIGYLSLFIPIFYDKVMHQDLDFLPKYYDYQFKAKYSFNSHHSLTFLSFGNNDSIDIIIKDDWVDPSDDPAIINFNFYTNDSSHSQGMYYTYKYNERFTNTLIAYGVENQSKVWYDMPELSANIKNLGIISKPYIFGIKDKLRMEWIKKHAELRAGIEARYYLFKTGGSTIYATTGEPDLNDPSTYAIIPLGKTYKNKVLNGYIENKFTFGGLIFVPGLHSEYFLKTKTTTVDPRGMISYTFSTGTTIGAAGGWYSQFVQTSPVYFTYNPDLAEMDYLKPQRSIHRSVSLEQKISQYTLKAEGFYNNFWDIIQSDYYTDANGSLRFIKNEGKLKTYGAEFLAKINDESEQGLFGWISYTWNRSKYITHQSVTMYEREYWGETWLTTPYDMTHMVKAVAGYTWKKFTLSGKFQYNTATPYTAIVASYSDDAYIAAHNGRPRICPLYGKPNTERFADQYQGDLRLSYKDPHRWGYISWYFEAIGAVSSPQWNYKWDYRFGYSDSNPKIEKQKNTLGFLPNFGVEVKF